MKIKEIAIESIKELPNDVTWEDIKERIDFIAGVRKGLMELDEGRSNCKYWFDSNLLEYW